MGRLLTDGVTQALIEESDRIKTAWRQLATVTRDREQQLTQWKMLRACQRQALSPVQSQIQRP
jgi:hypothetical protein